MSQTICVLYGINEGPAIGSAFETACREASLETISDPHVADLIFAHSGGCLLVPPKNHARVVLMVGIPYRPNRPWLVSTVIKVRREGQLHRGNHELKQWARKLSQNIRYAGNLKASWRMLMNLGLDKPWNSAQHQIIIRNQYDAYCTPDLQNLPFNGPRTFISFPGEHDDCWENPKPYIKLLQVLQRGGSGVDI